MAGCPGNGVNDITFFSDKERTDSWIRSRVSLIMPALNLALNADFEKKH